MDPLSGVALALLQDSSMDAIQHDLHLQMIFTGILSIIVLIGFLAIVVGGLMALKLVTKGKELADRLEGKVNPLIDKSHSLVTELSPKVRTITENVEQISYTVRGKVDEVSVTVSEINKTVQDVNMRTRAQVAHVDQMVGEALDSAHHVSRTVQEGVRKPVQQIAGLVAGVRAGIEKLIERSPLGHRASRPADATGSATSYEAAAAYQRTTATEAASGSERPVSSARRTGPYDL